ncbi:MAG: hypothetical protein R3F60_20865 [bacterium]
MPVTFQNWTDQSGRFLKPRSPDLLQVDQRVTQYRNAPSYGTLRALASAILDWRAAKGNWTTSSRAREMVELINLVKAAAHQHFPQARGQIFSWVRCEPLLSQLVENTYHFLNHPQRVLVIAGEPNGPKTFRLEVDDNDNIFNDSKILLPPHAPGHRWFSLGTDSRGPGFLMESVEMHRDITPHTTRNEILARFHPISRRVFTTGQLTGCCFIMRRNAGILECTHIQPLAPAWANGHDLQNYLESLDIPGATFYGRNQYGGAGVSIIGRLEGGQWNVYAQRYERGHFSKTFLGVDHILVNG